MKNNNNVYENIQTIEEYKDAKNLTKPEISILEIIKNISSESKMLDIGVGTGRTTFHFAPLFKEYFALDYSSSMIDICKQRFNNSTYNFVNGDARNMNMFDDNTFDFIFFSFNGIDCVSHSDRIEILKEIKRIGKPNSYFAFSTHNIYNVTKLFSFQMPKNPLKYFNEYKRMIGVRKYNPDKNTILTHDFYSIIDGDLNFTTEYIYYKPQAQIKQLNDFNFNNIKIFSLKSGNIIDNLSDFNNINDAWLYYLCINNK